MEFWRICKRKYQDGAFTGIGGLQVDGRWHRKGCRIVYTASSLSLATAEAFVHYNPETSPSDLCRILGYLPNSVSQEIINVSDLPTNWTDIPSPNSLRDIGTDWINSRRSLCLIVPSAVVAGVERNIRINPQHKDFHLLRVAGIWKHAFDPRMFGK